MDSSTASPFDIDWTFQCVLLRGSTKLKLQEAFFTDFSLLWRSELSFLEWFVGNNLDVHTYFYRGFESSSVSLDQSIVINKLVIVVKYNGAW